MSFWRARIWGSATKFGKVEKGNCTTTQMGRNMQKNLVFCQKFWRTFLPCIILFALNWHFLTNSKLLLGSNAENDRRNGSIFSEIKSGIQLCRCKRKVENRILDLTLLPPSTCSDFSTARGPHQNVISYSLFGDIQVSLKWSSFRGFVIKKYLDPQRSLQV